MVITEQELIEKVEARNSYVEHIEVLEKVGNLLLLDELEMATTEMVAKFYNVVPETIKSLVFQNREEIELDGYKVWKTQDFRSFNLKFLNLDTFRGGFYLIDRGGNKIFKTTNKGIALFPKRAILRVGMLLRDSEVAKELRTRLLDIIHDAEHTTNIVDNVFQEIRTEQEIGADMMQAILEGDFARLSILQTELIGLKNRRIIKLETDINILENNYTTFDEFKRVANACLRAISSKDKRPLEKMWGIYYKFLYDKEGISVNVRYENEIKRIQKERVAQGKQPYSDSTLKTKFTKLRTIKPHEYEKCLQVLKGMAIKYGVDLEKVVKLDLDK